MMSIRRLSAASLFLAASLLAPFPAFAQNTAPAIQTGPLVKRNISITELGFADGAHMGSLGGTQIFYFPISHDVRISAGTLSFAYDQAGPFDGRRSVLVTVGNRAVFTRALPVGHERQSVDVPLIPSDFTGDFIKVTVQYSGVVTNDRCVDARLANDRFTVLPETTLALNVAGDSLNQVSSVLSLMPQKVALGLPERALTEQEMAAAISAVRLLKSRGHEVAIVPLAQLQAQPAQNNTVWQRGDLIIATPADLGSRFPATVTAKEAQAQASIATLADGPGLVLSGTDPQVALNFLGSNWRDAAEGGVIRVSTAQPVARSPERLTFDQLGVVTPILDSAEQAAWGVDFSAKDLPAGRWPTALDLDMGVGTDGSEVPAVVNVFLNGRFLGGTTAATQGVTRLHVDVPQGLVGLSNQVRVVMQRQPRAGDCTWLPASFPAQLLGSSSIVLGKTDAPGHDFFSIAPRARDGLTVFVRDDLAGAAQRTALQVLGTVAGDLSPADATVTVKRIDGNTVPKPDSVFLAWGNLHFADDTLPVRIDQGNVIVRTLAGTPLINLNKAANTLVAQLVTLPDTPAGVWVRAVGTQDNLPTPQAIGLDRGNVAFVGTEGVTLALSTERDKLIEVTYPDVTSWQTLARRYGTWLVIGGWLFLTVVVLVALQRIYRRRQQDHKGQ
jgi:cellulose synthase operon protein B